MRTIQTNEKNEQSSEATNKQTTTLLNNKSEKLFFSPAKKIPKKKMFFLFVFHYNSFILFFPVNDLFLQNVFCSLIFLHIQNGLLTQICVCVRVFFGGIQFKFDCME